MKTPDTMQSALTIPDGDRVRAEVAVVGLGAGGSMAFHDLACAGIDVVAIELGSWHPTDEMTRREEQMLPQLFMEGASRATQDLAIRVLQGKGVGGSTLHNTNLCKRLPPSLLDMWSAEYGLSDLVTSQLTRDFEDVERLLNVHPVPPERVNRNNDLLDRGARALGWHTARLDHNRDGCKQSGFCELGCPNNGKQNAAKVLIPPSLSAGGRILTEARVDRIAHDGQRATALHVTACEPLTYREPSRFVVEADTIILAASATNSAALALQSKLPDPHSLTGTNLHMHPGAFVVGLFDEPVYSWQGVPQSMESTQFLTLRNPEADGSVWLVSGAAHPSSAAALMPGFGPAHGAMMRQYPHCAVLIAMLHDHSSGRVLPGDGGEHVQLHYRLGDHDRRALAQGLREGARLFLAAGARVAMIPTAPPRFVRHDREIEAIDASLIAPFSPSLVAVHPMSTMWMGSDPRRSVVDATGRHHHLSNLYVADGSLFPTSIGGPPQIPIYVMGRHVARAVMHAQKAS